MRRGPVVPAPFLSVRSRPEPSPVQVQFVMVRLVDSQWLEPLTLGSLLVKVTSQETLVLVVTVKDVLVVVSDAGDVAVSGQLYSTTLTNATSPASLTTTNTSFTVTTSTSVSWLVTFTSSDPNVSGSSHCESTSLTITN